MATNHDTPPERTPKNINYFTVNDFSVKVFRSPHVEFFAQRVSVPGLILGDVLTPSTLFDVPQPGDKLTVDQLNIGFILDEDFQSFIEIYDWMVGLGFPESHEQFQNLKAQEAAAKGLVSDIQIFSLTGKKNPNVRFTFKDAFPVNMATIDMDTSLDPDPYVIDVGFRFSGSYKIEKI